MTTNARPTVYIVDDQPAVCHALSEMLSVLGYQVETFSSADNFLNSVETPQAGCLIADVRMPGMDGIQLMHELGTRGLHLPVILISGHADVPMAVAAIKAGAEDFIEKPVDDSQLVAAINRCLAQAFEQLAGRQSLQELERRAQSLTRRESEVLDLVVQGFTSHAIAARLGISPRTVESYRVQIMDKMQAESVAILVRQAIRLGRLSP
ncbi:MAG: response regulator transcription factor [Hyphomicrobiaceae bacterium]|jgi:two-component system response regulator FixJ